MLDSEQVAQLLSLAEELEQYVETAEHAKSTIYPSAIAPVARDLRALVAKWRADAG